MSARDLDSLGVVRHHVASGVSGGRDLMDTDLAGAGLEEIMDLPSDLLFRAGKRNGREQLIRDGVYEPLECPQVEGVLERPSVPQPLVQFIGKSETQYVEVPDARILLPQHPTEPSLRCADRELGVFCDGGVHSHDDSS